MPINPNKTLPNNKVIIIIKGCNLLVFPYTKGLSEEIKIKIRKIIAFLMEM